MSKKITGNKRVSLTTAKPGHRVTKRISEQSLRVLKHNDYSTDRNRPVVTKPPED